VNGDKAATQKEYRAVVDAILKNPADRTHYYADFDSINGGKDVNL
jgi:hypothetical protein